MTAALAFDELGQERHRQWAALPDDQTEKKTQSCGERLLTTTSTASWSARWWELTITTETDSLTPMKMMTTPCLSATSTALSPWGSDDDPALSGSLSEQGASAIAVP